MKILVTNDDGIHAEGIKALWEELVNIASRVFVVAPDEERSAMSQALTLQTPLRAVKHKVDKKNVVAWRINGTPADCSKIAMEQLLTEKPDLIVSGINHGPNLATDIFYSGTLGAAREGVIYGVPAIATSLVNWSEEKNDFKKAAVFVRKLVEKIKDKELWTKFLLNVNIPNGVDAEVEDAVITKMGHIKYKDIFEKRKDPRGKTYYWLSGTLCQNIENEEDTDYATLKAGKVSIMPMNVDFTFYDKRLEIQSILK